MNKHENNLPPKSHARDGVCVICLAHICTFYPNYRCILRSTGIFVQSYDFSKALNIARRMFFYCHFHFVKTSFDLKRITRAF